VPVCAVQPAQVLSVHFTHQIASHVTRKLVLS